MSRESSPWFRRYRTSCTNRQEFATRVLRVNTLAAGRWIFGSSSYRIAFVLFLRVHEAY